MDYYKPETVRAPRGRISKVDVIYDGGENKWSLARLIWDGEPQVAVRWNGGRQNEIPPSAVPSVGTPSSRGYPTWFLLPEELGELIEENLQWFEKLSKPK
jgi:hypothetical protein